ncbi:MAG: sulfur oxidation c-type cytochrome SoxX [Rhodobacterales bacterium]|jgi:L-cysteine S-thiosulfotransferase|nr:sulfur oxidation c-type cytochrome SoxX [Rhodobacter sp.]
MKPFLLVMVPVSMFAFATVVAAADVIPGEVMYQDGAVAASLSGAAGDADAGKKVMTTRSLGNCVACHQVDALSSAAFHGNVGPTLNGAASRWTEAQLRGIVADSKKTFEGSMMPSFYKKSGYIRPGNAYTGKASAEADLSTLLTAQQIEDVVAFLKTLKE